MLPLTCTQQQPHHRLEEAPEPKLGHALTPNICYGCSVFKQIRVVTPHRVLSLTQNPRVCIQRVGTTGETTLYDTYNPCFLQPEPSLLRQGMFP